MLDCPRCFWLDKIKGIKRPAGIFPSLPSGMDFAIKRYFDLFRDRKVIPPELEETGCELFSDKVLKTWRRNYGGIRFTDPNTDVELMGAVDDILIKNGKLIVIDYKTRGFPLKEDTQKYYRHQMDIYNFLLRKNGFKTEDFGYLLFYYPDEFHLDGKFSFFKELVKIDVDVKNAENLFSEAIKILSWVMPDRSKGCGYCKTR